MFCVLVSMQLRSEGSNSGRFLVVPIGICASLIKNGHKSLRQMNLSASKAGCLCWGTAREPQSIFLAREAAKCDVSSTFPLMLRLSCQSICARHTECFGKFCVSFVHHLWRTCCFDQAPPKRHPMIKISLYQRAPFAIVKAIWHPVSQSGAVDGSAQSVAGLLDFIKPR